MKHLKTFNESIENPIIQDLNDILTGISNLTLMGLADPATLSYYTKVYEKDGDIVVDIANFSKIQNRGYNNGTFNFRRIANEYGVSEEEFLTQTKEVNEKIIKIMDSFGYSIIENDLDSNTHLMDYYDENDNGIYYGLMGAERLPSCLKGGYDEELYEYASVEVLFKELTFHTTKTQVEPMYKGYTSTST